MPVTRLAKMILIQSLIHVLATVTVKTSAMDLPLLALLDLLALTMAPSLLAEGLVTLGRFAIKQMWTLAVKIPNAIATPIAVTANFAALKASVKKTPTARKTTGLLGS